MRNAPPKRTLNQPYNSVRHRLTIIANNQPTVLERVLQVTRYRGFEIIDFNASINPANGQMEISLTVKDLNESEAFPKAGVARLYHQLNKLFDLKHVNLAPVESIRNHA